MATATHGMNPAEVEELGNYLQACGQQLIDSLLRINSELNGASWVGPDAETFKDVWWPDHLVALKKVAHDLEGFGQSALNNAQEQRNISSTGGDGTGVPPGGAATADVDRGSEWVSSRIPEGSHASASDYANEITHLEEGQIAYREVAQGPPPRYVVMLRGVDDIVDVDVGIGGGPGPGVNIGPMRIGLDFDVNGAGTSLLDGAGFNSKYQDMIRTALDRFPEDAEIGIVGHSQGGIAAAQVAEGDPRIQDILVLGSGVESASLSDDVSVMVLENQNDGTTRIPHVHDGRFRVGFDSGSPDDHGLHESYLPALEELQGHDNPDIHFGDDFDGAESWLADFEHKYGGDGSSSKAQVMTPNL